MGEPGSQAAVAPFSKDKICVYDLLDSEKANGFEPLAISAYRECKSSV